MLTWEDLYTAPASQVTYALVRQFVLDAEANSLFSESLTFEAKGAPERHECRQGRGSAE